MYISDFQICCCQANIKQGSIPIGCVPPACQLYTSWWPPLGVSTSTGVGPKVNKFEQVSNDDHQMSVVGEGVSTQAPHLGRWYPGPVSGWRYNEVTCIMGNSHIGHPSVNRRMSVKTLVSRFETYPYMYSKLAVKIH